jgi:guanylate kinase
LNKKSGLLFIISAPAGTGKTTLVQMLTKEFPSVIRSITYTTREPRPTEKEGQDYFFLTESVFQEKIEADEFLEHATVFGFHYGTDRKWIEKKLEEGKHIILVIDTQGAVKVKKKIESISIFISPPSLEELKQRLLKRKTETAASLEKRLKWAEHELEMISHYDYHIVNDSLSDAYNVLKSILIAEEHKVRR